MDLKIGDMSTLGDNTARPIFIYTVGGGGVCVGGWGGGGVMYIYSREIRVMG